MFRVFTLAYSTMTIRVIDLHSLCAIAQWIIAERQAEDGHFLEKGPVIMTSMQVPTAPLIGLFKQNPGLCTVIGGFQAPALFSGRMRKGKSRDPVPSITSLCSGPCCILLQCGGGWVHLEPHLSLILTSSSHASCPSSRWA